MDIIGKNIMKNKAFILIESIISMWILIVVLLIFFEIFSTQFKSQDQIKTQIMIEQALLNKLQMQDQLMDVTVTINGKKVPIYYKDNKVWLIYENKEYSHQLQ